MKRPLIISAVIATLLAVVFFVPGGDALLEKKALTESLTVSVFWRYSTLLERLVGGAGGLVYESQFGKTKKVVLVGDWLDWKGNTKLEWRPVAPGAWDIVDIYYGSVVRVKADGEIMQLK